MTTTLELLEVSSYTGLFNKPFRFQHVVTPNADMALIDACLSKDDTSFIDFWWNGTGVSFHIGKYQLDLCSSHLLQRGTAPAERQD